MHNGFTISLFVLAISILSSFEILALEARKKWTLQEDQDLLRQIEEKGLNWKKILLANRTSKQAREHYLNCLKPGILRTKISQKEGEKILELSKTFGNRWSEIAKELPSGRTPNQIKNFFHANERRRKLNAQREFEYSQKKEEVKKPSIQSCSLTNSSTQISGREIAENKVRYFTPIKVFVAEKILCEVDCAPRVEDQVDIDFSMIEIPVPKANRNFDDEKYEKLKLLFFTALMECPWSPIGKKRRREGIDCAVFEPAIYGLWQDIKCDSFSSPIAKKKRFEKMNSVLTEFADKVLACEITKDCKREVP